MTTILRTLSGALLTVSALLPLSAVAQNVNSENWFQIEVTIFTFEDANLGLEKWSPNKLNIGFPERLRRVRTLGEALQLSDWSVFEADELASAAAASTLVSEEEIAPPVPLQFGPRPYAPSETAFQMPDLARSALWQLPTADHDFSETNRALSRSAGHRVVYHGVWRQVLTRRGAANAIAIKAGRQYQERSEIEGSLNFYLTNNADRAILETNLWLNSFSRQSAAQEQELWQLPALPTLLAEQDTAPDVDTTPYHVTRIIAFQQSRELRAEEFHYLDHPAMGLLVQLTPYTVPPLPEPEPEKESAEEDESAALLEELATQ